MKFFRRSLLVSLPALTLLPKARAEDARLTPRSLGNPDAPVKVNEWYSLTCTHCAHFNQTIFPTIKTKLIDTGKINYTFREFPLDQIALLGTMVARSLPANRYIPFVNALLASQDRWAFAPGVDPKHQIQLMAALAGISAAQFARIDNDAAFRKAIIAQQDADQATYNIGGTPFFRFNNISYNQELLTYEAFEAQVKAATP